MRRCWNVRVGVFPPGLVVSEHQQVRTSRTLSLTCKKHKRRFSSTESDQRKLHISAGFLLGPALLGGVRLHKHQPGLKKQEPIRIRNRTGHGPPKFFMQFYTGKAFPQTRSFPFPILILVTGWGGDCWSTPLSSDPHGKSQAC